MPWEEVLKTLTSEKVEVTVRSYKLEVKFELLTSYF